MIVNKSIMVLQIVSFPYQLPSVKLSLLSILLILLMIAVAKAKLFVYGFLSNAASRYLSWRSIQIFGASIFLNIHLHLLLENTFMMRQALFPCINTNKFLRHAVTPALRCDFGLGRLIITSASNTNG